MLGLTASRTHSNSQPEIEELEHRAVLGLFAQSATNAVGAACEPAGAFRVVRWHGPGATAGYRTSIDFDFFSAQPIDPRELYETLDFVAKGRITQEERNTLTVQAETEDGQLLAQTVEAIRKVPAVAVAPLGRIGEIAPGNPVLDPK